MPLTRSFKELVESQAAADPAFAEALRCERVNLMTGEKEDEPGKAAMAKPAEREPGAARAGKEGTMTPAREALLAFAKAWTYPILGNEDVPVVNRLFEQAEALAKDAAATAADPPEFAGWLAVLRDKSREGSDEWEDTLHAVADYFGLSTETWFMSVTAGLRCVRGQIVEGEGHILAVEVDLEHAVDRLADDGELVERSLKQTLLQ